MIPPDVASALRLQLPDQGKVAAEQPQNQPVAATQRIVDALRDLQPGQRFLAEIQSLLPNGSYRAVVGQRDITLALPFSANAGDTLELEVVDKNGQVTLALVANRGSSAEADGRGSSVTTALSQTGRLIGDLLSDVSEPGKRSAAPLNGNQPLVESFPASASDFAPVLKQALTQSGVFYEAHQAKWVAGEIPTESLRQEPQGKLAPQSTTTGNANFVPKSETPLLTPSSAEALPARTESLGNSAAVPRELAPIVQQQLDGLATQNYAWQGQVWPGQNMWWEIAKDPERNSNLDIDAAPWRTRLKLALPNLGGVDARIQLQPDGGINLNITTSSTESEALLQQQISLLQTQFEATGLQLRHIQISHGEIPD